ncbi:MAG: yjeF-like protein hydroxyethylthiazole kinaserelated protein [Planctomycetota bacterium]|nr:yjeF-like protein hydroxyethylthiazole kinaserelated protein [Planctomycetota bacterium]
MAIEPYNDIPKLKPRDAAGHKGDYGTVMVLGGGRGMAGAAALAGAGALRSGAGKVRIACPFEVQPTVAQFEPSYMAYPLQDDGAGHIDFPACAADLERLVNSSTVLVVGPGLGTTDKTRALMRWVLESVTLPTIIDADGLNCLEHQADLLHNLKRPVIVTPHPKEFSRISGVPVEAVQADREAHAVELAQHDHLIVVLKGSGTIVTDGTRVYTNRTGNPGMATGGSGDILGGIIGALIGQSLAPFEAAVLGAYAHGLAGDIAKDQNGEIGMIAGDIVDSLADAFFHLVPG